MTDRLLMEIADISISVRSRSSLIERKAFPEYKHFITDRSAADGTIAVQIDLQMDNLPDISGIRTIFESEESWSMHYDGEHYFLKMQPSAFQSPFWVARFNADFMKATIYYGELFRPGPDANSSAFNAVSYPLDQILLMHLLAGRSGALVHAAGMSLHGRGYIFPGRSGAGKSTLSKQFPGRAGVQMLSDDRIIVRKLDGMFKAFGTPWPGDAGIAENKSAPLSGIFFIHHAAENRIKEIKPKEAFERLMPVTSIPWYDERAMSDVLSFCEDLVFSIPSYELHFRPDAGVVDLLEEFAARPLDCSEQLSLKGG